MNATPEPVPTAWSELLEKTDPAVRRLADHAREVVREVLPDAVEEVDSAAELLAYTFQPGTYKGLVAAVALHRRHVNIMFGRGVELAEQDPTGLLEGTGKRARHIKITRVEQLDDPAVRDLLTAAVALTPHG